MFLSCPLSLMSISEGTGLWYKISRSKPQDTEPEIFTLDILPSAQSRQQGSSQCH